MTHADERDALRVRLRASMTRYQTWERLQRPDPLLEACALLTELAERVREAQIFLAEDA